MVNEAKINVELVVLVGICCTEKEIEGFGEVLKEVVFARFLVITDGICRVEGDEFVEFG